MADEQESTGNRATVALVSEKVDGLRSLVEAGFADMQRQLDLVAGTPAAIAALREIVKAQEIRIMALESSERARRVHWPTFVVSIVAVLIAGIGLVAALAA